MPHPPKPRLITALRMPPHSVRPLPGGARLLTVPQSGTEVTTLRVLWPGGYADSPTPLHARIASMLITEGSAHYPGDAIARAMDHAGAKLSVNSMASHTFLSLTALTSQMPRLLPVVADMVAEPELDAAMFGRMRRIAAMQYATSLTEVDCRADILLQQMLMGPDYTPSRIMAEREVMSITVDEVRSFCRQVLSRGSHALLSLSGGAPDSLLRAVEDMAGQLPRGGEPPRTHFDIAPQPAGMSTAQVDGATQCALSMGIPLPPLSSPGSAELFHAVTALGGYFGSRLMSNIREEKGLTYGIYASVGTEASCTHLQISAQCDRAYADAVIEETRAEMLRLAAEPPAGEELHRIRQTIGLELAAITDSPTSAADNLTRELIGRMPAGFLQRRIDALDTVSTDGIARAAAQHLRPDALRIALAGDIRS